LHYGLSNTYYYVIFDRPSLLFPLLMKRHLKKKTG
jgi:hypothetical protein